MMKKKHLLIVPLGLVATLSFAKELTGIFEIPLADGEEGDIARVEVTIHDDDTYSGRVLIGDTTSSFDGARKLEFSSKIMFMAGQVPQTWQVSLEKDEVTMIVKEVREKQSREHTWIGKLTYDLEGSFEFPPREGESGDVIIIELVKNDEDAYSAQVTVLDETVTASNVSVVEDQFTFNTEENSPDGKMSNSWTVAIIDGKINLTMSSDIDGNDSTIVRLGRIVNDETE